jgi:ribosomal-protein-alanine N-acetyltransferase
MGLGLTYYKRYRMEISLVGREFPLKVAPGYALLPWDTSLIEAHAEAKYHSFRQELDSTVFPCLGEYSGCLRLIEDIASKQGFLPQTTWLAVDTTSREYEYCGTIQGIRHPDGYGAIQNLGVTTQHRGRGLGTALLRAALCGFQAAGLRRAVLEVTALNEGAVRMYRRQGFHKVKTVYKVSEAALA